MARISNTAIAAVNSITTALALAAIALYLYLHFFAAGHQGSPTHCQRTLQWPLLAGGLALLAVSLLGLLGSCRRFKAFMLLYVALIFFVIVGWFAFSVFVFTVTNKGAANAVSGVGYHLGLDDYSHWLQRNVVSGSNWRQIRSCLADANVCKTDDVFYKKSLSPIQLGCCAPPPDCRLNATEWEISRSGPATTNPDCSRWSYEQSKLCYNCDACKAGVLFNIRKSWRHFAVANAVVLAILIVVYSVGCCAIRNDWK